MTDKPDNGTAASARPDTAQIKSSIPSPPARRAVPSSSGSGFAGFMAFLAFLLAGGAGGGVYYLWQQQQLAQQQLAVTESGLKDTRSTLVGLQGDFNEEFINKFKGEFISKFKGEFKDEFKDEFKEEFKQAFKPEFKEEFKDEFKDAFKIVFKEEFKGEFKEEFKGEFKEEFKLAFKPEFKEDFKDEFKSEFKKEFKDEFKEEFRAEFSVELEKKLQSSKAELDDETQRIGKEATRLNDMAATRFREVEQRQTLLQANLEGLYARISNISKDWLIAEAEYLMQVANHRLILERDVTTAKTALTLADKRLRSVGEPALVEVRESIARQLTELEAAPHPDIVGTSAQLSSIADKIDSLPLRGRQLVDTTIPEADRNVKIQENDLSGLLSSITAEIKNLVKIEKLDTPLKPMSLQQVVYLHENLKIKLEQVRLSLLQREQRLFDTNLKLAVDWMNEYYDTDKAETKTVIAKLEGLTSLNLNPTLPDLSVSARSLQAVITRLGFARETTLANEPDASAPLSSNQSFVDAMN